MENLKSDKYLELAQKISARMQRHPSVVAIALGGSQTAGSVDYLSDIDLYVYRTEMIPLDFRQKIVAELGASRMNMNLTFWDIGDEWFDEDTGIEVDLMYWHITWIEDQIKRVVVHHQASVGRTTCFWYTIQHSKVLYDPSGWFERLQQVAAVPYPEKLRNAIIAKNHPILRQVIPAYYTQIKKALQRNDLISVNHRVAELFASYFDVLFALNKVTNPGEKKIIQFVFEKCATYPPRIIDEVNEVLAASSSIDPILLEKLDVLLDGLDALLTDAGIDPEQTLQLGV